MKKLLVLVAFVANLFLVRTAVADASITFVPPSNMHVIETSIYRTDDTRPSVTVEGNGGTQLLCSNGKVVNKQVVFTPCGPPPPTCSADVCAVSRPSTPLKSGIRSLEVELLDSDGSIVAQDSLNFTVDTTPPRTLLQLLDSSTPLHPVFHFGILEDDSFNRADTAQCSFTRRGARVHWQTCPTNLVPGGTGSFKPPTLPARHIDWVFKARAVDDFGRPDPKPPKKIIDPVPCVAKAQAVSIGTFISSGLPVTVTCSIAIGTVDVLGYSLGTNSKLVSTDYALHHRRPLAADELDFSKAHTEHLRLRLYAQSDAQAFQRYNSETLLVRVALNRFQDGLSSNTTVTVRR